MSRASSLDSPLQHTEVSGLPSFLELEPEPTADPLGLVAGRYELGTVIARGGMGTVYRARDRLLNRTVAVKVLRSRFASRTDLLRRFLDEAQIASKLQHPGVVPVYEVGAVPDGRPFIAMKLVEGLTLSQLLKDRQVPSEDLPNFLKVFDALVQTVSYAHSRGIIHRDLKPENVMVGAFGEVQVMDWGLAKFLDNEPVAPTGWSPESLQELQLLAPSADSRLLGSQMGSDTSPLAEGFELEQRLDQIEDEANLTRHGEIFGTAPYMPPEQARGQTAKINRRSDVFSLGAILCEIITGKPPYVGEPSEVRAKAQTGALNEAYHRLDRSATDPSLVLLAKHCLAVSQKDRPESATELNELLQDYFSKSQARARAVELHQMAVENQAAEAHAREKLAKRSRQFSLVIAVVSVLFAGLLVSGFVWAIQNRNALINDANELQAQLNQQIEERDQEITALRNGQGNPPKTVVIDADEPSQIAKELEARRYPEAIELLSKRLANRPEDSQTRKKLAQLLEGTENYADAEKVLREGINSQNQNGEWSQQLEDLKNAYAQTPVGLLELKKQIDADPNSVTTRLSLARAQVEQGRYRDAVSQFRSVMGLLGESQPEQLAKVQKEMRDSSNLMALQLKLSALLEGEMPSSWDEQAVIAKVGMLSGKAKEVLPICEKLQDNDSAYAPLAIRCALMIGGEENQRKALVWFNDAMKTRKMYQKDTSDLRQIPEARKLAFAPAKEASDAIAKGWQKAILGE